MPVFISFYSFKGGVGRTLSVANVATLLARDAHEPCRVLVWDFDLPAPGLQQVFNFKWKDRKQGFVDYVHQYLSNAKIEEIGKYIYPTEIAGVDILPAGTMDRAYAEALDQIQWREIYAEARGFEFLESVKKQISAILPAYDYVLIDSLTGFSDVGGICVQQLPDIVVLLFRLNKQNLAGIAKVYASIESYGQNRRKPITVVPVISPAWPFAAPEASSWIERAENIFKGEQILQISFEGSLSFGEKIITAKKRKPALTPKIVSDYEHLATRLRRLNPQDARTMFWNTRDLLDEGQFSEALDVAARLVKKEPSRSRYWQQLTRTVSLSPKLLRSKMKALATAVIDDACEQRVPKAYVARAELLDMDEGNWEKAYRDISEAIKLEPEDLDNYFARGAMCHQHKQYREAIADFSIVLRATKSSLLSATCLQRGLCYLALGESQKAIQDLSRAAKSQPGNSYVLVVRARAIYVSGEYSKAETEIDKALELNPSDYDAKLLRVHILAANGQTQRAKEVLQQLETSGLPHIGYYLSLAEAYLVVDPKHTLRLIDEYKVLEEHGAAWMLRCIAAECLGDEGLKRESLARCNKMVQDIRQQ